MLLFLRGNAPSRSSTAFVSVEPQEVACDLTTQGNLVFPLHNSMTSRNNRCQGLSLSDRLEREETGKYINQREADLLKPKGEQLFGDATEATSESRTMYERHGADRRGVKDSLTDGAIDTFVSMARSALDAVSAAFDAAAIKLEGSAATACSLAATLQR